MYYSKTDTLKWFLLCVFAFLLPISQQLSTYSIFLIVAVSIISLKPNEIILKRDLIWPVLIYIMYVVSLIYSSELQLGVIEQKASLIIFPLLFMLNNSINNVSKHILKYFVYGSIVALVMSELNALFNAFDFIKFSFNSRLTNEISFHESIQNEENYFFSYNFSYLHQTVYFSMYLAFSVSILLYYKLFKNIFIQNLILIFLIIGILQTLNKASIIILFFVFLLKIYRSLQKRKTILISFILISTISTSIFILNPRFNNFYNSLLKYNTEIKETDFKKIKNTNPNQNNFRLMLWDASLDLIKENPILGIGAGGSHIRLYEVFAVKRQWYDRNEKYHAHNQFLQIFLDIGVIGFTVFVLSFLFFYKRMRKFKDTRLKSVMVEFFIIIFLNFLFESMFERYSGISFYSFFYCLFVCLDDSNNLEKMEEELNKLEE